MGGLSLGRPACVSPPRARGGAATQPSPLAPPASPSRSPNRPSAAPSSPRGPRGPGSASPRTQPAPPTASGPCSTS
eukprot:5953137-Pyramimonas_sp.AAC.1